MSETRTLGRISVITDTDNGYERIGETQGGFQDDLKEHIRKYGSEDVLMTLARMISQVTAAVSELRIEAEPPMQACAPINLDTPTK